MDKIQKSQYCQERVLHQANTGSTKELLQTESNLPEVVYLPPRVNTDPERKMSHPEKEDDKNTSPQEKSAATILFL